MRRLLSLLRRRRPTALLRTFDESALRLGRLSSPGPGAAPSQQHGAAPGPAPTEPEPHTLVLLSMLRPDMTLSEWASWHRTLADILEAEGALRALELQNEFLDAFRRELGEGT